MKVAFCLQTAVLFLSVGAALGETVAIDPARSVMTIRVFRSGLFSVFAHNHEIETRGIEGEISPTENQRIGLRIDARKIKVLDPQMSADDRLKVQETMEGPEVLDVARFPDIRFESTSVNRKASNRWEVSGNLTLHGQTRPVTVEVTGTAPRYTGEATLRQRDFGIEPVSLFGGTVKVKDEVKIEFDIHTAAQPTVVQTGDGGTGQ